MSQQSRQPLMPLKEICDRRLINRKKYLDFFWEWGNRIPWPGCSSIAFVGLRRTGKTAIIHRVFNRLFTEQDRVMPVFITFEPYLYRTEMITTYEFAREHFTSYLRSFLAFRHHRPELHRSIAGLVPLRRFATEAQDKIALDLLEEYDLILEDKFTRTRWSTLLLHTGSGYCALLQPY